MQSSTCDVHALEESFRAISWFTWLLSTNNIFVQRMAMRIDALATVYELEGSESKEKNHCILDRKFCQDEWEDDASTVVGTCFSRDTSSSSIKGSEDEEGHIGIFYLEEEEPSATWDLEADVVVLSDLFFLDA